LNEVAAVATSVTEDSGNTESPRASSGKMFLVVVVATLATGLLVVDNCVTLAAALDTKPAPATASNKTPSILDSKVTTKPLEMVLLSAEEEVIPYSAKRVVEAPTVV